MRTLALDIGDRRIGVAVSDPTGLIARPLAIITRKDEPSDIQAVAEFAREYGARLVVIGLPLSLDGRSGSQSEKVRLFSGTLAAALDIPIEMHDERFSTVTAREYRLGSGAGKKKRQSHDDDAAAAVILQNYLDEVRESR